MLRGRYLSAMIAVAIFMTAAADARPSKQSMEQPYSPVRVTIPAPPDDPSLTAFRQELASVAKGRVYADLARLVTGRGFFWHGPSAGGFNPDASGVENLAAAIRLESDGGSGWKALAAFAAASGAVPLASRPGVICAPAPPNYDPIEFDRLLAATGTWPLAWHYLGEPAVPLRPAPSPSGRAIETLGPHLIRVLASPDPSHTAWARVAAPSGKTGFIPRSLLVPLESDRLCFQKDVTGRWQIAGFIAN
jgi:hypothetical protein